MHCFGQDINWASQVCLSWLVEGKKKRKDREITHKNLSFYFENKLNAKTQIVNYT